MLQITNLEKSYGKQLLFDSVNLTVNPSERVGLVGRNGHGKTTLFRLILGEEHAESDRSRCRTGTPSVIFHSTSASLRTR